LANANATGTGSERSGINAALQVDYGFADFQRPGCDDGTVGLALTLASDCLCATCTVGGWPAAIFLWPKKNAMKSAFSMMRAMKVRTLAGLATGNAASRDGTLMAICRGNSAIRRVATVRQFMCVDGSLGNVSINAANLQAALSRGMRDNFAASCQGSTSNLASAEMTLSSGRSLPSSTEAYRNASNSD